MFAKLDSRISSSRKKADAASAAPAPPPGPGLGDTSPKPDAGAAPPPAPTGPKALREQYEATSTELKTTKARITEMERKLADAEARGRDTTALTQRLADMEKEKATLQGELRAFRAEKDPEFQAKWEKPFDQAAEYARKDIEGLTIYDENENPVRQATWDDFVDIYKMSKGKAITEAKAKFGPDAAGIVLSHISDLKRMDWQKNQALNEERANFSKREQEQTARQAMEREAVQKMWMDVNKDLAERHPEWYQPDPTDEEGNTLLADGYKLVDSALANRNAMTLQQKVILDAQVRNRAAAFTRSQHQLARARERIAELEAIVAGKKAGLPTGDVLHQGSDDTGKTPNWKDELRETLK